MPRKYKHDYRSRCIYHITLIKAQGIPAFGELFGELPNVKIVRSLLGSIIERNIWNFSTLNPLFAVQQYSIMPDHIHLLLFVKAPIDLHLGKYISKFKIKILQEYRRITGCTASVFDKDFYDCILHPGRSLNTIYRYIRENPRRLAVRRAHPEYFRRVNNLTIGDKCFQAYGNLQLIENPFKEQVVVHRIDSSETREQHRHLWLYTVANGGVLVSPFISPAEKAIRTEAEEAGGKIILITHEPMDDRYKPSGHDFDRCEAGKLLIISANLFGPLLRDTCLIMNDLAHTIAIQ